VNSDIWGAPLANHVRYVVSVFSDEGSDLCNIGNESVSKSFEVKVIQPCGSSSSVSEWTRLTDFITFACDAIDGPQPPNSEGASYPSSQAARMCGQLHLECIAPPGSAYFYSFTFRALQAGIGSVNAGRCIFDFGAQSVWVKTQNMDGCGPWGQGLRIREIYHIVREHCHMGNGPTRLWTTHTEVLDDGTVLSNSLCYEIPGMYWINHPIGIMETYQPLLKPDGTPADAAFCRQGCP
jgi:hypothetical protein